MHDSIHSLSLSTVCLLGGVLVVFGSSILLCRRLSARKQLLCGSALSLPLVAILSALLPEVPDYPFVVLTVGSAIFFLAVVRSERSERVFWNSARLVRHPVFASLALLIGGTVTLAFAIFQIDSDSEDSFADLDRKGDVRILSFHEVREFRAATDRGNPVVLRMPDVDDVEAVTQQEARMLQEPSNSTRLVRVAGPEAHGNCHGYVFAEGRFWIAGSVVDRILSDNDYQQMSLPQPGDVVVYRDDSGSISHSGLVRTILAGNKILVASKWGVLGTYLHFVENSVYGKRFTYYRTHRPSHSLNIMPTPLSPVPLSARAG